MGSRGDVQPFVALGMGLVQVGQEVTIGTSDRFESLIREWAWISDRLRASN